MLVSATEMLKKARDGHYAVGQFNINNLEWTKAVLLTAEELKSPVILGVSEGAGKYMTGFKTVAAMVKAMVETLNLSRIHISQKAPHQRGGTADQQFGIRLAQPAAQPPGHLLLGQDKSGGMFRAGGCQFKIRTNHAHLDPLAQCIHKQKQSGHRCKQSDLIGVIRIGNKQITHILNQRARHQMSIRDR